MQVPVRLPLSVEQERCYALTRLAAGAAVINRHRSWRISGRLDPLVLRAALARLTQRHEILRTSIAEGAEGPAQGIHDSADPDLAVEFLEGYPKLSLKKYKPIAARNEDANVSRGLL